MECIILFVSEYSFNVVCVCAEIEHMNMATVPQRTFLLMLPAEWIVKKI